MVMPYLAATSGLIRLLVVGYMLCRKICLIITLKMPTVKNKFTGKL